MNIAKLHASEKKVSAIKLENDGTTTITAIRILKNEVLAKHITKVPAVLICVSGKTNFETEKGEIRTLAIGDYVNIEPNMVHWLTAVEESNLILIK